MGGFLASPGGGAAAGSIFGPVGTIIGGIAGTLGSILLGGGGPTREYWDAKLREMRPDLFQPAAPTSQPTAPPEFDFTDQTTDTTIYDEPVPELGQLPFPVMPPWLGGGYNFPEFTPTFGMDVYGEPITEQSSSTTAENPEIPQLSPLPIPPFQPWMIPTFPGYPDPTLETPDDGTPTFPMDVWAAPIPLPGSGGQQAPVYETPPQGPPAPPPIITEPPPPISTPIPSTEFPPPVFPGPPVTPPPAAPPKVPGLGDLGALLGALPQGGPSVNLGGLNAPVVGGGTTNSLFPLPGINRFDIPSLGAYLLGRM